MEVTINLRQCVSFMSSDFSDVARKLWKDHSVTRDHTEALQLMGSSGESHSLWTSKAVVVDTLRIHVRHFFLPMMSSTHIVEFGVRKASLCADSRRSESIRSAYALIRSIIAKSANRSVVSATKHLPKRANQHVSAGLKGQREVKSKIAQRKHGGSTETPSKKDIIQRTPCGAARETHVLMRTLDDKI